MPPLEALAAYPAAYVLGYVAIFAPAGIGIREGFLIAFLDPILGAGAAALWRLSHGSGRRRWSCFWPWFLAAGIWDRAAREVGNVADAAESRVLVVIPTYNERENLPEIDPSGAGNPL